MRTITIAIPEEVHERLRAEAYRELRDPRMQARVILERALAKRRADSRPEPVQAA